MIHYLITTPSSPTTPRRVTKPSFRTEQADAFSFTFAPANVSAGAERNLSSIFTLGSLS